MQHNEIAHNRKQALIRLRNSKAMSSDQQTRRYRKAVAATAAALQVYDE